MHACTDAFNLYKATIQLLASYVLVLILVRSNPVGFTLLYNCSYHKQLASEKAKPEANYNVE